MRIRPSVSVALTSALIAVGAIAPNAIAGSSAAVSMVPTITSGPNTGGTQTANGDSAHWTASINSAAIDDPRISSVFHLTGRHSFVPGSVLAPFGVSVRYSEDGTTWGTSGSTSTKYLKFTGPIAKSSAGVAGDLNPAGAAAQAAGGGGGGDGFGPILGNDRVFNIWHHNTAAKIECRSMDTGQQCPGYPYQLQVGGSNVSTSTAPQGIVDNANQHLWVAVSRTDAGHTSDTGYACIDIGEEGAAPSSCGWFASGYTYGGLNSGGVLDGKLYGAGGWPVSVFCFDPVANGGTGGNCSGFPVATGMTGTGVKIIRGTHLAAIQTWVWPTANDVVGCVDLDAAAMCSGWGGFKTVPHGIGAQPIPMQTDGTNWDAFCLHRSWNTGSADLNCFKNSDGSEVTPPTNLSTLGPAAKYNYASPYGATESLAVGHRTYMTLGSNFGGQDAITCYDWTTGSQCPNYPYVYPVSVAQYQSSLSADSKCIWTLGDSGNLVSGTVDDPAASCAGSISTTTLQADPPTSFCGNDESGSSWDKVRVRGVSSPADYSKAYATVKDENGDVVSGFDHVQVDSNGSVDISSIPKSGSTSKLTVDIEVKGIDPSKFGNGVAQAEVTWTGGSAPDVCFDTTMDVDCSIHAAATNGVDDTTDFVDATGTSVATSSGSTNLVRISEPIPSTCATSAKSLTSRGPKGSAQYATPTKPSGASVTLLDGSGDEVSSLTVAGEGTYSVDGSGKLSFTPDSGFAGGSTAGIAFRLKGAYGSSAEARYTPFVTLPPPALIFVEITAPAYRCKLPAKCGPNFIETLNTIPYTRGGPVEFIEYSVAGPEPKFSAKPVAARVLAYQRKIVLPKGKVAFWVRVSNRGGGISRWYRTRFKPSPLGW